MANDPFRGAFEDGEPRDPKSHWYKSTPMSPDRLATVLNDFLRENEIKGYLVHVERDNRERVFPVDIEDIVEDLDKEP